MRKHTVSWSIALFVLLEFSVKGFSQIHARVSLQTGGIRLEWDSTAGNAYEVQFSPGLGEKWRSISELIEATGPNTSFILAHTTGTGFFRIAERSVTGTILLQDGEWLSGGMSIDFAASARNTEIQYAALLDVYGGKTNTLYWIDPRREAPSFPLDTTGLRNGYHAFLLELMSTKGPASSDDVDVIYSEPVEVYAGNTVSMVLDDTEWKFNTSFSFGEPGDLGRGGTYRLEVRTNGAPWRVWTGDIQADEDQDAIVTIADNSAQPFVGYKREKFGDRFEVILTVDSFGETTTLTRFSRIIERAPNSYTVIGEALPFVGNSRDRLLLTSLQTMGAFGSDYYDLANPTNTDNPQSWSVTTNWSSFVAWYQTTNAASHMLLWPSSGGPSTLQDADLLALRDGCSKKATFVVICGINYPRALLKQIIGETTDEDVIRGKYPAFGLYFRRTAFASSFPDAPPALEGFLADFLTPLYARNALGKPVSYREALEAALANHPSLSGKVMTIGCAEREPGH
jgi:hypothetical protein